MTRAYRLFILAAVAAALSSCSAGRELTEPATMVLRDSVIVNTVTTVHDTTVLWQIPDGRDSAVLPDTDTSRLRTSLAESEAWVSGGKLHHTLHNRGGETIPVILPLKETRATCSQEHLRLQTVTRTVEKPLTWLQQFWMALGKISALILAVLILRHFV